MSWVGRIVAHYPKSASFLLSDHWVPGQEAPKLAVLWQQGTDMPAVGTLAVAVAGTLAVAAVGTLAVAVVGTLAVAVARTLAVAVAGKLAVAVAVAGKLAVSDRLVVGMHFQGCTRPRTDLDSHKRTFAKPLYIVMIFKNINGGEHPQ